MKMKPAIIGWALYDFGCTIFSLNVISLYFALWVTVEKGCEDIFYSVALSLSLLAAALLGPLVGTISDIYRKRTFLLMLFTVIACVFTAALGSVRGLFSGLLIFVAANLAFHLATVLYNALLAVICKEEETGRVSGLGVGLGYVGAIVGILLTRPFVLRYGYQAAFIPTAVLFLIFSLPCFFLVKENGRAAERSSSPDDGCRGYCVGEIYRRIKEPFLRSGKYPGFLLFLLSAFIFLNAINTVIIFMSVYARKAIGLSDSELMVIYLVSTVTAIAGAFFFGVVTDRIGARRTLTVSLLLWGVALVLAALVRSKVLFLFIGPLFGVALGSIWTASRALIVSLTPREKVGEVFGIFGMVGRLAAITGPLIWGLSVLGFGFMGDSRYRAAMFIQCLFVFAGWMVFRKVPEEKWGEEEGA